MRDLRVRAVVASLLLLGLLFGPPSVARERGWDAFISERLGLEKGPLSDSHLKLFHEVYQLVERNHVAIPPGQRLISGAMEGLGKKAGAERVEGEGGPILRAGDKEISVSLTEDAEGNLREFARAYHFLRESLPSPPEPQELIYAAIDGMLATLDPHTHLLRPEAFRDLQRETRGEFSGLGLEITLREGNLTVVAPIEGTPAERAGLRPKDEIIEIDGVSTQGMNLPESVRRMRGPEGTRVTLSIQREGSPTPLSFSLVREVIKIRSIRSEVLEGGVGYVRVRGFLESTRQDLQRALREVTAQGVKGLILDLRNNPGGLLRQAVEVADTFLKRDSLIVSTRGRRPDQSQRYPDRRGSPYEEVPLVVLVNAGSASAAEIVTGALQDHRRALILGRRTFGKGSVQSLIPLSDGSGLRLTTSHYFTPNGREIQEKGILPDVLVPQPGDEAREIIRERELIALHRKGGPAEREAPRPRAERPRPTGPELGSKEDHQLEVARRLLAEHPTPDVYELLGYANRELEGTGEDVTPKGPEPPGAQAEEPGEER